jgi:hypothetical protein
VCLACDLLVARVFLGIGRRVDMGRPGMGGRAGLRAGAPNPCQRGKQARGSVLVFVFERELKLGA